MGTRHSEYREDPLGWYVEHPDVSIALFDKLDELGLSLDVLHDPSCGQGNIIDVALARGIRATGADIVDRASGRFAVRDFPRTPGHTGISSTTRPTSAPSSSSGMGLRMCCRVAG